MLTDGYGRNAAFSPTSGNVADIPAAPALLVVMPSPRRLIVDRRRDANSRRKVLAGKQSEAVKPPTGSSTVAILYDKTAHRDPNQLERAFLSSKDWRRGATRYD